MFILSTFAKDYYPVALMHGYGLGPESISSIESWIRQSFPKLTIYNAEFDGEYSKFTPIPEQAKKLQEILRKKPEFKNGFVAYGLSQGGLIMRYYLEELNDPPILRLITQATMHGGYYNQRPGCLKGMCDLVRPAPLSEETQQKYAVACYFKDFTQEKKWRKENKCLAVMDNYNNYQEYRRENVLKLDYLVLVGSKRDGLNSPWESQFFGWFQSDVSSVIVQKMEDRELYKKDLIGLRELNEKKRIIMIDSGLQHLQNRMEEGRAVFIEKVVQYFQKER